MKTYRELLAPIRKINERIELRQSIREFMSWQNNAVYRDVLLKARAAGILKYGS